MVQLDWGSINRDHAHLSLTWACQTRLMHSIKVFDMLRARRSWCKVILRFLTYTSSCWAMLRCKLTEIKSGWIVGWVKWMTDLPPHLFVQFLHCLHSRPAQEKAFVFYTLQWSVHVESCMMCTQLPHNSTRGQMRWLKVMTTNTSSGTARNQVRMGTVCLSDLSSAAMSTPVGTLSETPVICLILVVSCNKPYLDLDGGHPWESSTSFEAAFWMLSFASLAGSSDPEPPKKSRIPPPGLLSCTLPPAESYIKVQISFPEFLTTLVIMVVCKLLCNRSPEAWRLNTMSCQATVARILAAEIERAVVKTAQHL